MISTSRIRWDRKEVAPALEYLESQTPARLVFLTQILNKYHHADHDAAYYDLLFGEWLLTFSHVVYAAYLHVERGMPHPECPRLIPVFSDYRHFLGCIVGNPKLSEQITAIVAGLLGERGDDIIQFSAGSIHVVGESENSWRHKLRRLKRSGLGAFSRKDAGFVFCQPHLSRCRPVEWNAALWKWRKWAREEHFDHFLQSTKEIDTSWRTAASKAYTGTTYEDVFRRLLPLFLPVAFLEAFRSLREQARSLQIPRPKAISTANSLHGHTLFPILAADWHLEGTKILVHQHGGNYGLDRIHAVENYETRVSDRFYTLGWSGGSPKQRVLPGAISPGLFFPGKKKTKILLNCMAYPPLVYRLHFQPMPGTIETMLDQTAAFVTELRGRAAITLRPSPIDYAMRTAETLRVIDKTLAIDNPSISGILSYVGSGLVVHNYLGTAWLETLALNIPTVCFYDPETYAFRENSLDFITALKGAGILHDSGREAARFVLSIKDRPHAWWQSHNLQSARHEFVSRYAVMSSNWTDAWENEFAKWIG